MPPLAGIRVLDLSRLAPGGYCTMLLADLGAEVIKIEEPGSGDGLRSLGANERDRPGGLFLALGRSKKSLTLNLKAAAGREIFMRLARDVDVLVEGFRPGVMARLGLGYEDLRPLNPRLVYCSLSGYGQHGPYRNRPGHDVNYLAVGGLLGLLAGPGEKPVVPGLPLADLAGGLMAVVGILAALVARARTGAGQYLDVSMLDAVVALTGIYSCLPARPQVFAGALPGYNVYETADGRYMALGALEGKFWNNFCRVLGREDLMCRNEGGFSPEEREEVARELQTLFRTRTRDEWAALFRDQEACCDPVYDWQEVFSDPQVQARGLVVESHHPREGKLRLAGVPVKFSATPARVQGHAPALGEHTEEILRGLGYSGEQVARLREDGVV
ncbi:MAG: CaiB/BaiF CoA transferase family protein [Desulfotomaculales bacterium]